MVADAFIICRVTPETKARVRALAARDGTWLQILSFVWRLVRLPIVTLLLILEPVVSLVFSGLALLGVLMTLFYNLIRLPHFPTWTILSLSVGFGIVARIYRWLIQILAA